MTEQQEFYTVSELAELLRIKDRKVYDLAATGKVPCTRVTGKLLFPKGDVHAWINGNDLKATQRPSVLLGSHDPLLEWAIRQSQCGLATLLEGSADGLRRFVSGEGVAAGIHLFDPSKDIWNLHITQDLEGTETVLLNWANRQRGLIMRPEQAEAFASMSDLGLAAIATRALQTGTAVLFDHLSAGVEIGQKLGPFQSEQDAVLAVVEGEADVAFGLLTMARQFGLAFTHLVDEEYGLVIDRKSFFEPPMQTLLAFSNTQEFLDRAKAMAGYDLSQSGKVVWNA